MADNFGKIAQIFWWSFWSRKKSINEK